MAVKEGQSQTGRRALKLLHLKDGAEKSLDPKGRGGCKLIRPGKGKWEAF